MDSTDCLMILPAAEKGLPQIARIPQIGSACGSYDFNRGRKT
jgi:hypothetical protein